MRDQAQKIHCIGIGGIGVSALAALWRAQGKEVSGSDVQESEITEMLKRSGVQVNVGTLHVTRHTSHADVVVYSDAVPEDNVERAQARRRGIPELSYAQALGQVSRQYRTIVVTGTHGKSTTTAMLGLILEAAGFDPLVLVGSRVPEWGNSNLRLPKNVRHPEPVEGSHTVQDVRSLHSAHASVEMTGKINWFVVEGDDYRDHFLELQPYGVVVTSIEWDHPDYFRDLAHTVESFRRLVEKVSENGLVVLNQDDPGCQLLRSAIPQNRRMAMYGRESMMFSKLKLQVPGEFNRYNATAAATAAMELGVSLDVVRKALYEFKGIWRRFEVVGTISPIVISTKRPAGARGEISHATNKNGVRSLDSARDDKIVVISDYAHHPTAIRETMKAAREQYPDRRLVLVYQPHQHSRTKHLFNDFVEVLKDAADLVILSEIYAVKGRMEDQDINSHALVDAISNFQFPISKTLYGGSLAETKRMVLEQIKPGDVVIFMGAGDIDNLALEMTKQ